MAIFTEQAYSSLAGFSYGSCIQVELEFGNVGLSGGRKTEEKNIGARTRTNNKLNPHRVPGRNRTRASALTTVPTLLPGYNL